MNILKFDLLIVFISILFIFTILLQIIIIYKFTNLERTDGWRSNRFYTPDHRKEPNGHDSSQENPHKNKQNTSSSEVINDDFLNETEDSGIDDDEKSKSVNPDDESEKETENNLPDITNLTAEDNTLDNSINSTDPNNIESEDIKTIPLTNREYEKFYVGFTRPLEDNVINDSDFPPIPHSVMLKPDTDAICSYYELKREHQFEIISNIRGIEKNRYITSSVEIQEMLQSFGDKNKLKEIFNSLLIFPSHKDEFKCISKLDCMIYKKIVIRIIENYIRTYNRKQKQNENASFSESSEYSTTTEEESEENQDLDDNDYQSDEDLLTETPILTNEMKGEIISNAKQHGVSNEYMSIFEALAREEREISKPRFECIFGFLLDQFTPLINEIDTQYFELINCILNTFTTWYFKMESYLLQEELTKLIEIYRIFFIHLKSSINEEKK